MFFKNQNNSFRVFVLFGLSLFLFAVSACNSDDTSSSSHYYVATDGDDQNSGDAEHPFRTIARARDAVRADSDRGSGTIYVNIGQGTYRLASPLVLGPGDSGGSGAEVVYQAQEGETVVISGAVRVTDWSPADGQPGVWTATVDTNGTMPRQLYVNGRRATRARTQDYPNYYTPTATGYHYEYTSGSDPEIKPDWKYPSLVEAVSVTQWKMMRCPVDRVQDNDVIMQNDCWKNANVYPYPWNFHLLNWWENAREFLDEPGEWFLNPQNGTVYYYPLEDEDMFSGELDIELPVLEKLIDAAGEVTDPVKHIKFSGLQFQYATWLGPNTSDGYALDQSGFILRGAGHKPNIIGHDENATGIPGNLNFVYARNITFENSTFTHLGGVALNFGTGSQNNAIINNTFKDISAAAIQLGGIAKHDHHPEYDSQLTCDNHIANNLIEYPGQEYYDAPGIYLGFTTRSLVEHNEINHTPWTGIAIGWGWGLLDPGGFTGLPNATIGMWGNYTTPSANQDNQVIHNSISHFLEKLWDGGAIYCTGFQGASMEKGLLLAWNVAQNKRPEAGGNTFYTDGGSRYVTLRQNVSLNNPQGIVDFGPCGKSSSFSAGDLCMITELHVPYGEDMGGCVPYGDMVFENNFLRESLIFYAICESDNYPDAPYDMTFMNNVKVSESSQVPAWILESAGRQ